MKSDNELQKDVLQAIGWEQIVQLNDIKVVAHNGMITLSGSTDSYGKKMEVEHAVKNVIGVALIVNVIEVTNIVNLGKSDDELSKEILQTLAICPAIPTDAINILVSGGCATLEGEVQWNHQRKATHDIVAKIFGVSGITNNIKIKTQEADNLEKAAIESALKRNSSIKASDIVVNVTGHNVILRGSVGSFYQKEEAGRLAWNAPGVWSVNNELVIDHDNHFE